MESTGLISTSRSKQRAECHPERQHHGHELCQSCCDKDRYQKNRAKKLAQMRAYQQTPGGKNTQARKKLRCRWGLETREKVLAYHKAWYKRNREKVLNNRRAQYQKHKTLYGVTDIYGNSANALVARMRRSLELNGVEVVNG